VGIEAATGLSFSSVTSSPLTASDRGRMAIIALITVPGGSPNVRNFGHFQARFWLCTVLTETDILVHSQNGREWYFAAFVICRRSIGDVNDEAPGTRSSAILVLHSNLGVEIEVFCKNAFFQ
jgi:hypothetical protein